MFNTSFKIEPVIFVLAKTVVPGVKTEYYKYDTGVKFHFWGEPEFPKDFGDSLTSAFSAFPKDNVIVEYVPEVDSWYGEVKELSILNEGLIERMVEKISKAVQTNGQQ